MEPNVTKFLLPDFTRLLSRFLQTERPARPPSNWQTGASRAFPFRSHSAQSKAPAPPLPQVFGPGWVPSDDRSRKV
jgi:hypothetical protein